MEITLAKIQAAEADVARLVAEEQRMRQAASADGTIDPKEQADLDRILGKITQGRDVIARLRADYEANKAIWDGKAGDLATLQTQIGELQTWGDPVAAEFGSRVQTMTSDAGAEQWKAATAALQSAQNDILAPYAEYQRQSAAKAIHDPARAAFNDRLASALATDMPKPDIMATLAEAEGAGAGMDEVTAQRDYVAAQSMLDQATARLTQAETDLAALATARDSYTAARVDLDARMAVVTGNDFVTMKQRQADIVAKVARIDEQAAAFDFANAQTATVEATNEATALQQDIEMTRLARDAYQALKEGIEARMATANAEGAVEMAPKLEAIAKMVEATKPQAEAEDYAAATAGLEAAAVEMGGFEELLAARREYLDRLAVVMPKVVEHSVSTEHNAFLQDIQSRMIASQTAMEAAAKALDFPTALTHLGELEAGLAEIEAVIEAKRVEFQTERDIQFARLEKCDLAIYPEILPRTSALHADFGTADSEAAAEHFDLAMQDLAGIAGELDLLEADILRIETELKDKIRKLVDPVEKELPNLKEPSSPGLTALLALLATIAASVAAGTELVAALASATEAAKQLAELKKVHAIMKRVEDKWSINQDDAARDIVAELKASGDLNGLPMEARNYLVEKMLSGSVSDEDHKAIQDVWSEKKFVDRRFDEIDAPIRKKIVDTFLNDPKVKQYEADWPTMTEDQKMEAIKHMTAIPCGPDGWNVGSPKEFKLFSQQASSSGSVLLGDYSKGPDRMRINTHPDAEAFGFDKLVDTITHEIGHKQQAVLIKGYDDGTIKPGDASYNQAKALKMCEDYRNNHNSEFKKIYESSPEESHSRTMGDEIATALKLAGGHGHGP